VLLTDMTLFADALSVSCRTAWTRSPPKTACPGRSTVTWQDLRKSGAVPRRRLHHHHCGDDPFGRRHHPRHPRQHRVHHRGQLFLRRDTDIGKVIVDPFRSLSRLKQLVIGKKTREDHPQVMNAAVRLYADAANAAPSSKTVSTLPITTSVPSTSQKSTRRSCWPSTSTSRSTPCSTPDGSSSEVGKYFDQILEERDGASEEDSRSEDPRAGGQVEVWREGLQHAFNRPVWYARRYALCFRSSPPWPSSGRCSTTRW
jgi:hypothetical protein